MGFPTRNAQLDAMEDETTAQASESATGTAATTAALGRQHSLGTSLVVVQHSAPSDASLVAGKLAIWFDQTNGAAKLMVKAKQADGTVRTGSLSLS